MQLPLPVGPICPLCEDGMHDAPMQMKLNWLENHGEYEVVLDGQWGFIVPDPPNYRAYDGRFARTEFGTGFLGLFATLSQAAEALEAVMMKES